jgi:hypothetical protein
MEYGCSPGQRAPKLATCLLNQGGCGQRNQQSSTLAHTSHTGEQTLKSENDFAAPSVCRCVTAPATRTAADTPAKHLATISLKHLRCFLKTHTTAFTSVRHQQVRPSHASFASTSPLFVTARDREEPKSRGSAASSPPPRDSSSHQVDTTGELA